MSDRESRDAEWRRLARTEAGPARTPRATSTKISRLRGEVGEVIEVIGRRHKDLVGQVEALKAEVEELRAEVKALRAERSAPAPLRAVT
jgi:NTP pyrophosphatase (non-canonical NTP hydrolase)